MELLHPSALDPLRHEDDGPYEAGGEKDQDPALIPLPAHSYLGTAGQGGVPVTPPLSLRAPPAPPRHRPGPPQGCSL